MTYSGMKLPKNIVRREVWMIRTKSSSILHGSANEDNTAKYTKMKCSLRWENQWEIVSKYQIMIVFQRVIHYVVC